MRGKRPGPGRCLCENNFLCGLTLKGEVILQDLISLETEKVFLYQLPKAPGRQCRQLSPAGALRSVAPSASEF